MVFYIINEILLLGWAALLCWRKPSDKKNQIFVVLSFTQLLLVAILRLHIGNDYDMYANGFYQMSLQDFWTMKYEDWEIGFIFLTKVMTHIIPNYIIYMGVLSVLCILPIGIYIYKYSKMPWVSVLLYFNMFIFFMEMNFVRQAIALVFVVWAWHFFKENRFIPFAVLILIGSLFHQTVLIFFIIYFWVKMKPGVKALLAYGYLLLCFYIASGGLFNLITQFFHEEYNQSFFITTGVSFMYCLLPVVIALLGFFLYKTQTIEPTRENRYLVNLGLLNAFIMITMSRHAIIERLSYYTLIFVILLVPVMVSSLKKNGIRITAGEKILDWTSEKQKTVLSVSVCGGILAISAVVFIYGLMHHAHGMIPYESIVPFLNFEVV